MVDKTRNGKAKPVRPAGGKPAVASAEPVGPRPPPVRVPDRKEPSGRCNLFPGIDGIHKVMVYRICVDEGGEYSEVAERIEDPGRFPQSEADLVSRYGSGTYRVIPKRKGQTFLTRPRVFKLGPVGVGGGEGRGGRGGGGFGGPQSSMRDFVEVVKMSQAATSTAFVELNKQTRADANSQIQFIGSVLEKMGSGGGGGGDAFTNYLSQRNVTLEAEVSRLRDENSKLRDEGLRRKYSDDGAFGDVIREAVPRVFTLVDRAIGTGRSKGAGKPGLNAGGGVQAIGGGVVSDEELLKELPTAEDLRAAIAAGGELTDLDVAVLWRLLKAGKLSEDHVAVLVEYMGSRVAEAAPG